MQYDLIVIGGGSAGIATARRASSYGQKVLLIECSRLGGTCVNMGCVPKKICFNFSTILEHIKIAKSYGIDAQYSLNFKDFVMKRDNYVIRLNGIYDNLLKKSNVEIINGYAELHDNFVKVNGVDYKYKNCLLATGAAPTPLKGLNSKGDPIEGTQYLKTSDDFFKLTEIPKKCVIIGSGYIAVELSFVLAELGCETHIIARGFDILSHFDSVIGDNVQLMMERKGIKIHFNTTVENITASSIRIHKNKEKMETINAVDFLMCAIGRDCNFDYIKVDIEKRESFLKVNDNFETSIKNVYALGDLIGPEYMLTPVAIHCGRILAHHLFKEKRENLVEHFKIYDSIASAIFSHPPCASVGISEKEARKKEGEVKVYRSKFVNMFFSLCEGEKEHFEFKIITLNEKVVGLHMFGMGSDEIVQGFAVAMKMGATYKDFKNTIGVHPTAAEEVVTMN